ncbi:uncharacterized protein LOC136071706 [Hydra vulgaris]|uniref:uncharacterized protein LOC136071706 n=1 Tax=Hydra vulgaris TaxID=6087 RepID=UPI0032EA58EE
MALQLMVANNDLFALKEQSNISRSKLLNTINVFPKEYEITFEACFTSFISDNSSWSNLLNFNTGNSNDYSNRTIGCNQYSISQQLFQYYNFTITISGKIIFTIKNTGAKEFTNVKMYFSDPWHDEQPGYIKNLLVTKGCSELFTLINKSDILHNNLLQTITIFPTEYYIEFEACLTSFASGKSSVLNSFDSGNSSVESFNVFYFTNSDNNFCVVCMWFSPNGEMQLSALINSTSYNFTTKPFELGCKQYKISQTLYQRNYVFTILVDGWTLSTVKNAAPQVFSNVQIYISNPWTAAQPGYTNNFVITRRCSDLFSLKEDYYIVNNSLFHTIKIFPKEYEITFETCLTSFTSGNNWSSLSNVFFFTTGGNVSCVLCMWFTPSGKMYFSATINHTIHQLTTKPFELGCKKYKIYQVQHHGYYILSIEVDELILSRVKNVAPQEFTNVKLYISDPRFIAQPGIIRNLIIRRGCSDCNLYYEPFLNVTYDGNIFGNVLDINFVINYNDPVESAVRITWEYYLPPFLNLQTEGASEGVVKLISNNLKYKVQLNH